MFKNKINLSLVSIVFLGMLGCGTMAKEDETLSVPQKVSIDMPKALTKINAEENNTQDRSSSYLELKDDIEFLETKRVDLEIGLLFISQVIGEIEEQCKTVKIEETCTIEEEILTFIYDENISKRVRDLQGKDEYEVGDSLVFGEVIFTEHNLTNTYQYELKMDSTFGDKDSVSNETIFWSKDENDILSLYYEESETLKINIEIDYSRDELSRDRMIFVEDNYIDKVKDIEDSFALEMLKLDDENEHYFIESHTLTRVEGVLDNNYSSVGELLSTEGYLDFEGIFEQELFEERNTFDGNGTIVEEIYCYEDMDCDLENEESWFTD